MELKWLFFNSTWYAWAKIMGRGVRLEEPVFIIGNARSGTTILAILMAKHSEVINFSEAEEVWEPQYLNQEIDHVKSIEDVKDLDAYRIKNKFKYMKFLKGGKYFINKNPINSLRIEYIKELFPDCKFIHIYRDGRAVVGSQMKCMKDGRHSNPLVKFIKPPNWKELLSLPHYLQASHAWVKVLNVIEKSFSRLSDREYLQFSYEHFCERPHAMLQKIDQFCGFKKGERFYDDIPLKLNYDNLKWKKNFTPKQIVRMTEVMETKLRQYGYNLEV